MATAKRKRRAMPIEERGTRKPPVLKAITTESNPGAVAAPASAPGKILEDDDKKAPPKVEKKAAPSQPERQKATKRSDPITALKDLSKYDPRRVTDKILRTDFRIVISRWYPTWKDNPGDFKHTRKSLERVLMKIIGEAVRRGPEVLKFNPDGMTADAREFFEETAAKLQLRKARPEMFKRLVLKPDTDASKLSTKELREAHDMSHQWYRAEKAQRGSVPGWSMEQIVNTHALVTDELGKRDFYHPPPPGDGLDAVSKEFEDLDTPHADTSGPRVKKARGKDDEDEKYGNALLDLGRTEIYNRAATELEESDEDSGDN